MKKFGSKNIRKQACGRPQSHGVSLKKQFGQHFLRDKTVVQSMLSAIDCANKNVFEIGCGDGFLTREIIKQPIKQLRIFEIDAEWASVVQKECGSDARVTMFNANVLDSEGADFAADAPWILLSNLPYQVTFPILKKVYAWRAYIPEGVIMVQEEVAQKITKTSGRGYGQISLFFQYYFDWKLLTKISPDAFFPPPSVFSRLLHFTTKIHVAPINQEELFWKFIKQCFSQPRRTIKNNLSSCHYVMTKIPESFLLLRAQQVSMNDFLSVWNVLVETL